MEFDITVKHGGTEIIELLFMIDTDLKKKLNLLGVSHTKIVQDEGLKILVFFEILKNFDFLKLINVNNFRSLFYLFI